MEKTLEDFKNQLEFLIRCYYRQPFAIRAHKHRLNALLNDVNEAMAIEESDKAQNFS